jgi:uncharacterized protein YlxW (UPF0749 family)
VATPEAATPAGERSAPVRRLWSDVLAPRGWRTDVPIAVLALLLGLGFAVTVRTERSPAGLASERQEDLVSILAELSTRNQQLQAGIAALQSESDALASGDAGVALQTAREREQQLGILAGTLGAQGPGLVVTIKDPQHSVGADVLVDALEELRDAGAEAMDLSGVRIVTESYVTGGDGSLDVDGTTVRAPYVLTAIGDAQTLDEALAIPGGVVDTVDRARGASADTVRRTQVSITSLRAAQPSRYAHPDPAATP